MTTIESHPSTTTEFQVRPSHARLRRRAAGGAILGAAGLSLAGFLLTPWETGSSTAAYLHSLTSSPVQAMVAASVLHFGYVLFVPTAFVLARLSRGRAPVLAGVGIVLAVLGSGLSGLVVTDAYDLSIGMHVGEVAGAPVSDMAGVPGAPLAFLSMGLTAVVGTVLGLVLLALAAWRARLTPVWPAIAILVGFAASYGAHDALRACGAFAAVAVALAYLGVRVLQLGDAEFEAH